MNQLNDTKTKVFVYGTLKKGYGNHKIFLKDSLCYGDAISTEDTYQMYCNGGFPMAIDFYTNNFYKIKGEIYEVSIPTLYDLDRLEGNGSLYVRELRNFVLLGETLKPAEAWVYLFNKHPWSYATKNSNLKISLDLDGKKMIEWERK